MNITKEISRPILKYTQELFHLESDVFCASLELCNLMNPAIFK